MRTDKLVLLAAVSLSLSCVKRIAPSAGTDQTGLSGVPLSFGKAQPLPDRVFVRWDFGDGEVAKGALVLHAFPRAGAFLATQIVQASDGSEERSTARITILRRAVASAIPADARAAFVLERPWARAALHKELASRVGVGEVYDEYVRGMKEGLGFDFTDSAQAEANGFDTDEGLALYTVPQDSEALVAVVGICDPKRSIARLKGLLTARGEDLAFVLQDKKLVDGTEVVVGTRKNGAEKVAFLERHGYLYLRTPGQSDPLAALASAAVLPPDAGLAQEKSWNEALARVGPGDAVFWSAAPSGKDDGYRPASRFADEVGASAFSIGSEPDFIRFTFFGQLRALPGKSLLAAFTPSSIPGSKPSELAQQLPAGASAFFKIAGSAPILWKQLVRASGADEDQLQARLHEWLGVEFERELLPTITGNGVVGVYLDASSLLEALLGEQVAAWDRSTFLLAGQVTPGQEKKLRAALDTASKVHGGARIVNAATFWRLTEGLQVALRGDILFIAVGGAPEAAPDPKARKTPVASQKPRSGKKPKQPKWEPTPANLGPLAAVLLVPRGAPTLGETLRNEEVWFLDQPVHQVGWIDLKGILRSLDQAAEQQGGLMNTAIKLLTSRARGLRDVLVDALPSEAGVTVQLKLRLQPRPAQTSVANKAGEPEGVLAGRVK